MTRLFACSALALAAVLVALYEPAPAAAAELGASSGDARSCRAEAMALRSRYIQEQALEESNRELESGLDAGQPGAPDVDGFVSAPENGIVAHQLDQAGHLADGGDIEGCRLLIDEARRQISEGHRD